MNITALNVANNILKRAFAEDIDITPMKLQKIIFCTYKEYLKKTGLSLFEEDFEAWRYGPVLPSVYNEFKHRGANQIDDFAEINKRGIYRIVTEQGNEVFKGIVNRTWDTYKYYSGTDLSAFTHGENTAWQKAISARHRYILDADIRQEADYIGVK